MVTAKITPNDVNDVMEAKGMDFNDFEKPRKTCIFWPLTPTSHPGNGGWGPL